MALSLYLNGQYYSNKEDAKVILFDHGLLYGDGIFEGIRMYHGRVFRLEDHIERLYRSARGIDLEIPMDRDKMTETVLKTAEKTGLQDAYIRLVVTRGPGDLGIDPRKCSQPVVFIIADAIAVYPPEKYKRGLRVVAAATRRNRPDSLNCQIKSLNYLNNILGLQEAIRQGADEAIMLNDSGYVTEATADNVFVIQGTQLITPPAYLGLLAGITRGVVMELGRRVGLEVEERPLVMQDLYDADEVFLTGTGAELVPVVDVDGRSVAGGKPGPYYKQLLSEFRERTKWDGVAVYSEDSANARKSSRSSTAEIIG
jgi:branched-chain amino acid aminotransferase